jgi:hypothetical protein
VLAVTGYVRWILDSKEFAPAPGGADHLKTSSLVGMRILEGLSIVALIALLWFLVFRPWRRGNRLPLDGMLAIGGLVAYFIDPLVNHFRYTFAWNAHAVNMGSWGAFIPGHGNVTRYGEGLLWAPAQYVYLGVFGGIVGLRVVNWLRRRQPQISNVQALAGAFAVLFILDTLLENLFIRLEVYTYARSWKALTLWSGSQFQWPIYEAALVGLYALGYTYIRLAYQDHGRTFVDAGIDRLRVTGRSRTAVLHLAYIGFAAVCAFLAWFGPWSWLSVNANSIAHLPSYLRAG